MRLVIPPNSTGRVILPATARNLRLAQQPIGASTATGITVTSGTHQFSWDE